MEDFKKLPKMQHFKTGGSVKAMCYGGKMKKGGEVDAADIKQDKAIVKKAFKLHDEQEHQGEKTDLSTLKKGGRAKKAVGTVKKFKTGGSVDNVYGAKKKTGDLDNIQKTKDIKPTKLCGGKSVKKMADGGSTGLQQAALLNALPGKANELERAQMAARARNALKYLGPAQQSQFVNQGGMNPAPTNVGAPAGSTIPAGRKKGGKVKKYADGSSVSTDDIVGAIRPGKYVDRMPTPKRNDSTNPTLSKAIGVPEDTKYQDRMPQRMPTGKVNIPGVGSMDIRPPKITESGAMLLKKGGKVKKMNTGGTCS